MAKKFLDDVELGSEAIRAAVVEFMPYSFAAVNAQSKRFLEVIELLHCIMAALTQQYSAAHLCSPADQGVLWSMQRVAPMHINAVHSTGSCFPPNLPPTPTFCL